MDPFIGEIRPVPFNFAPTGWALCQGQIMAISQNTALFSLLGTTFGGNGQTTFALPDLRGRVPLGVGEGGGGDYALGEISGFETVTLLGGTMPQHHHSTLACSGAANGASPVNQLPAVATNNVYTTPATDTFAADAISMTGQGLPHPNIQPYTAINYIIALVGVYPQRS